MQREKEIVVAEKAKFENFISFKERTNEELVKYVEGCVTGALRNYRRFLLEFQLFEMYQHTLDSAIKLEKTQDGRPVLSIIVPEFLASKYLERKEKANAV
jgi:hypothetical protein